MGTVADDSASAAMKIPLMADEGGALSYEPGITTMTFFKGAMDEDVVGGMRAQFRAVVAANPWLCGRLENGASGIEIVHPSSPSEDEVDKLCLVVTDDATCPVLSQQYDTTCRALYAAEPGKYVVPMGYNLVGTGLPLVRLALCKRPGAQDEFAVLFSVTHAIVDGHTYYDLYRMLEPGAAVRSLPATRVMEFPESMRDMVGREEMAFGETCDSGCLMCCMFGCPCCAPGPAKSYAFYVDPERVAEFKDRAMSEEGGVEFVSTNDVLTSGFFRACETRVGFMGFDCRGRMDGIEQDMAGNYVTALVLDRETFKTPVTLRKVLQSRPYKTTGEPLPTCCGGIMCGDNASMGMVTNWSSFAGDLIGIPGCEMALHLPVQNPDYVSDTCIPFMAAPGELAVLCWSVKADEAKLRERLPVGKSLRTELFPSV